MTDERITLLIVDDDYPTRLGLKIVFQANSDFVVVGEAENGEEAITLALTLQPNVIVLDFGLPGMNGAETALALKEAETKSKILMLTTRDDEVSIFAAFSAGVDGYCLKDVPPEQIYSAVQAVSFGAGWLHPQIAKQVLTAGVLNQPVQNQVDDDKFLLSSREKEVLQLIVDGLTNHQISDYLGVSYETVKSHVSHIFNKLMVSDRTQAAIKALREGIVSLG